MEVNHSFLSECDNAPRLNEMADFFSTTAAGRSGVPLKIPDIDRRLFERDWSLTNFIDAYCRRWGHFDHHYFSSIPYRLEEEARLGDAMSRYAMTMPNAFVPANFYVLGAAEGTLARTLAETARGRIRALSCSPNKENEDNFYSHGVPEFASFFLGPFHRLTKDVIRENEQFADFEDGFDLILEDTTFQMYSPNRSAQIQFVKEHLKPDGIMLFIEKFRHESEDEYIQRELQKDYGFKSRFFSPSEIKSKNAMILKRMNKNESTLKVMAAAVSDHFAHCYITWNSGNFYTLAASNSMQNLSRLISSMVPPCIPNEYVYLDAPQSLLPANLSLPRFRNYRIPPA